MASFNALDLLLSGSLARGDDLLEDLRFDYLIIGLDLKGLLVLGRLL
jgi:hypothetical protein